MNGGPPRELDYAPKRPALSLGRQRTLIALAILIAIGILATQYGERAYYALERIWRDCPAVPLPAEVSPG